MERFLQFVFSERKKGCLSSLVFGCVTLFLILPAHSVFLFILFVFILFCGFFLFLWVLYEKTENRKHRQAMEEIEKRSEQGQKPIRMKKRKKPRN